MKSMKTQKVLMMAVAVMVMVAMLSFSTLVAFADGLKAGNNALVEVSTSLNVRSGPDLDKTILTTLKNNAKVAILEQAGSWYKVKLASGKEGYVFGKYLSAAATTTSNSNTSAVTPKPDSTSSTDLSKLESDIILATTTSTQDTGLLDVLVPAFEKKYNVKVKTVAVGTGEAINMGKRGDADVLLVHSRAQENAFVADGYGVNRKDVMYNFFYVVGPKNDPVFTSLAGSSADAFRKIAESKSIFVSRADNSGTHTKEKSIWTKAGITPNAKTDSWYIEAGQGMGATLTMANEMGGYTLVDSGTWHAYETKVNMKVVKEGDSSLFNPYGVITVNPHKYPNTHYNSAMAFANFITSEEGQKIIGKYKKNGYQLFVPSAK